MDQCSCELGVDGGYVVLLHPEGNQTDDQLIEAGLPADMIDEVRALRLGPEEAIYVFPNDPAVLPSRTTYQRRYVSIPEAMVAVKASLDPVVINLAGPYEDRFVVSLH